MPIAIREIDGRTWKRCDSCHTYHGYQRCRHCRKKYKTPKGLANHERICYLNPDRECDICGNEGGYFKPVYDPVTLGRIDADWIDCTACSKAQKRRAEREEVPHAND
jgi:hypothetical protein